MDHGEPGLFDLPVPEPHAAKPKPRRARNRETWACTVTADVTIVDPAPVTEAIERYIEETPVFDATTGTILEDPALHDAGPAPTQPLIEQLLWLIWPGAGMEELDESGAIRIIGLDLDATATGPAAAPGTITWTTTVKLTDVARLRTLATQAHPEDADLIPDDFPLAWQHATDPYAPLRAIPGIQWQPRTVEVTHLPANAPRNP